MRLYQKHMDSVGMVILDVVMPRMGGRAAFDVMREINPDVKVLFASGYSMSAIHTNYVLDDGMNRIQKPYRSVDLLKRVREVLDVPVG